MNKITKMSILLSFLLLASFLTYTPVHAQESDLSHYSTFSDNQGRPIRIALIWNSELPPDNYVQNDVVIVQDIYRLWKVSPFDLVDLSMGLDAKSLSETYSAIIIPSVELLSPYPPFSCTNETRNAVTSAIVDYSLPVILGHAFPEFVFAGTLYKSAFNITTDGTNFDMGERYEQLFSYRTTGIDWIIGHSGNNIILHNSVLSSWWGLCASNESPDNEASDEDFTATDFFNLLGSVLPETIAWVFGVPTFTLRNDDIYLRSWNFEPDRDAFTKYLEFLRQEAGWIEASHGVVGLYDFETSYESVPYQKKLGNYGRLVSHSWTHPFLTTMPMEQQIEELTRTKDYLAEVYPEQFDPSLFIVPSNDWDERTLVAINETEIPSFTAAWYEPDPASYLTSPAKKHIYLPIDWYTVEYEGKKYSTYGAPWIYAYDAARSSPQGAMDFARSAEEWLTADYMQIGYSQTQRMLFELYYPLMMGTHGVLQAWDFFEDWSEITRTMIEGIQKIPYIRIADNGAAIRDIMNLEKITLRSASYDDSEITLNLENPGPALKNVVLFTNSFETHQIDQVLIDNSLHFGFGDNYVFVPPFTGSLQIRIKLVSSGVSPQKIPILRGMTTGGLKKTDYINSELLIEISAFESTVNYETTILSVDFSRLYEDPSKLTVDRIYVQGDESKRGIFEINDLKQDWDGWNYDPQTGLLQIKARIFGEEQVHILLSEEPSLTNHRPTVEIISPVNDSAFIGDSVITFNTEARDDDGDSLIYFWSSSRDGPLGNSPSLKITGDNLSPGNHTIMVTVAENGPNYALAGRDTVNIIISSRIILSPDAQTLLMIAAFFSGVLILIPLTVKRKKRPKKPKKEKAKSSLGEILYYAFLSNGPWLVATAVFLILGMGFMMLLDYPEKRYFAFSLGIATPVSLIVAGWLVGLSATSISDYYEANQRFSCRHLMKRFLMITLLTMVLVGLSIVGIMYNRSIQRESILLAFFFFISFTPLWYAVGTLNAFKQYGRMTLFFLGGIGVGYSLSILLATTGKVMPLIGLGYGIGYLIAAAGIFIYIFIYLLPTPRIQDMNEEEHRHLLALLTSPTRSDTLEAVQEKTSIHPPLTPEKISLLEDGLKLRLRITRAISLRSTLVSNSWLIIGALSYSSFIWIDRIFVWIATGQQTSGFVLAINSTYEIGVNIGLWVLVFTTGMIAFAFKDFTDRYITATARLYSETLDDIETGLSELAEKVFNQFLKIVAMATIIAVILFINAPQIIKLFKMGSIYGEILAQPAAADIAHPSGSLPSPSIFILRIAAINAIFIATFLYAQLGLSYLAMYKKAAIVLLTALGVAFPLVAAIIFLNFPVHYAVLGPLAGSIIASVLGYVLLKRELEASRIIHRYVAPQL